MWWVSKRAKYEHLNWRLCYIIQKAFHSELSLYIANIGKLSFAGE